jgi:hypothetical protein
VANIVVSALSTFNNKGLKKGKKEISIFEKQVKSFQRTFLAAFSVTALTRFSKEAVKAFAADEKAARALEVQLKNTGFQFSSPGVELYISNLQRATGVLDDELRPAFQQLLTVTGSITKSQDALSTALNVSAATGQSLSQVTSALSRGYAGNTTALTRLGVGLNKTLLKAGDMDEIMAELNDKFAGQAQARLTTYAGKMDLLKVASENVKEEIGKGILGALDALSKDTSIEDTTKKMEDLGKQTGDTITGLGVFIKTLSDIPGIGMVGRAAYETSIFGLLARLGRENRPARELPANEQRAAGRITAQQFRTEVRQKKELDRLRAAEIAKLKEKTAVDQLKDKFDIERIGLTKALNEATDGEVKLRLRAQLAILDNNEALAKKLLAEMEGTKVTEELTTSFKALSEATKQLILSFGVNPNQIGAGGAITTTGGGGNIGNLANVAINNPYFGYSDAAQQLGLALGFTPAMSQSSSPEIRITVDTSTAGDKLSQAIAETIQIATKTGYSTVPAGQGF